MNTQPRVVNSINYEYSPMVDAEFDKFEVNDDLVYNLRDAETATFYHDTCNPEE